MSLLPSTTEILFALGAGEQVVGVTFECDEPPQARQRAVVSTSSLPAGLSPAEIDVRVRALTAAGEDLYHLDAGALRELAPDVVVTQDLCAVCAIDVGTVAAALSHLGASAEVVTVDPRRLEEVLASISALGAAVERTAAATRLVDGLRQRLVAVAAAVADRPRPRVAVLEWTEPPYRPGHWVPDLVTAAGGTSVLGEAGARSTTVGWDEVAAAAPDVVVVAPCGFRLPAATALAQDLCARGLLPPGVAVWAIDADAVVVRAGPRLVDGVEALAAALHPGACTARPDLLTALTAHHPSR